MYFSAVGLFYFLQAHQNNDYPLCLWLRLALNDGWPIHCFFSPFLLPLSFLTHRLPLPSLSSLPLFLFLWDPSFSFSFSLVCIRKYLLRAHNRKELVCDFERRTRTQIREWYFHTFYWLQYALFFNLHSAQQRQLKIRMLGKRNMTCHLPTSS